jgi:hypothetical protein
LNEAIDALEPLGNTALYDAVDAALELASSSELSRRAVVLLTDGQDFGGVSTSARDESLAAASAVAFYTIGVGSNVDPEYLQSLADQSGGRFYPAVASDQVGDLYSTIEGLLRSQYILTFERGDAVAGEARDLTVTVDVNGQPVEASARYTSAAPAVPAAREATAAPSPAATLEPVTAPPVGDAATESGGAPQWAIPLLGLAVIAAGAGMIILWRWYRGRPRPQTALPRFDERPIERPVYTPRARTSGSLRMGDGDHAISATVGIAPISLGSDATCSLALDAAPGVAPVHARIWTRDGRVMLHHVAEGEPTLVNGQPVEWAVLQDGDRLAIGPHTISFALDQDATASEVLEERRN